MEYTFFVFMYPEEDRCCSLGMQVQVFYSNYVISDDYIQGKWHATRPW